MKICKIWDADYPRDIRVEEDGGPRSEETKVVYLGNLDGSRGIDVAIRTVHRLKATGHRVALDVIDGGPSLENL